MARLFSLAQVCMLTMLVRQLQTADGDIIELESEMSNATLVPGTEPIATNEPTPSPFTMTTGRTTTTTLPLQTSTSPTTNSSTTINSSPAGSSTSAISSSTTTTLIEVATTEGIATTESMLYIYTTSSASTTTLPPPASSTSTTTSSTPTTEETTSPSSTASEVSTADTSDTTINSTFFTTTEDGKVTTTPIEVTTTEVIATTEKSECNHAECGKAKPGAVTCQEAAALTMIITAGKPGAIAKDGQFPFMARLTISNGVENATCGATIIHCKYLLTAAHCVKMAGTVTITADAGSVDRTKFTQTRKVKKITPHGDHNKPLANLNDIALLELEKPWKFEDDKLVQPICLPDKDVGSNLMQSGWGHTELPHGALPKCLRFTTTERLDKKECEKHGLGRVCTGSSRKKEFTCTMVGTWWNRRKVCKEKNINFTGNLGGDSGGPTFGTKDGCFVLVGVLSTRSTVLDLSFSADVAHYLANWKPLKDVKAEIDAQRN